MFLDFGLLLLFIIIIWLLLLLLPLLLLLFLLLLMLSMLSLEYVEPNLANLEHSFLEALLKLSNSVNAIPSYTQWIQYVYMRQIHRHGSIASFTNKPG